ncbi:MAG: protease complex subunit PrcB family protein [Candidatus Iainarchaeum archaeon]|uniref:Protease complex subunit PrcB family protein n=1 Tax=Candidatus Iainarchaeum sp. TaxID=3101447 RepID=A0A7T9I1Z9_9ARCH|nr:MAG: protease complex subunit PrcB family protein [Candidatus Diapherotrites archaeon]
MHANLIVPIFLIALLALSGCTAPTGKDLTFSVLAHGTQSSFTVEQQKVFRTQSEFETFWKTNSTQTPLASIGAIDYGRETLILLALGEKSTGGYDIRVDRVAMAGASILVNYTKIAPASNSYNDEALTQPYVLIKVSRHVTPEQVQFIGTDYMAPSTTETQWMAYNPVQADNNPWQLFDGVFVNTPTEAERASAWLSSHGVSFTSLAFVPHDEIVCAALNCPRGDYLYVKASNADAVQKLKAEGFFTPIDPFVVAEKTDAIHAALHFVNPTTANLYYGGCNEFTARQLGDGEPLPMPEKTCVWEGLPMALAPQSETTLIATLSKAGTYDFAIGYGTGCDPAQPLSQGNCSMEKTIYSNQLAYDAAAFDSVAMRISLVQCQMNPWQVGEYAVTDDTDDLKFTRWLNDNGIAPLSVQFNPAPSNFVSCEACNCASGASYDIAISPMDEKEASDLGFVVQEQTGVVVSDPVETNFDQLTWLVINPYQCFANKWPVPKQAVKSIETDMRSMREWLESKGATIDEMALIAGPSTLNVECLKRTNNIYAVGVANNSDAEIVRSSGFVYASAAQTERFSATPADDPIVSLVYKTKYCTIPAWEKNPTGEADYATSASALRDWLDARGIPREALTIHTLPKSSTGSCDTDSGYGMRVLVPKWATYHLGPYGFVSVSTATVKNQVYPNKKVAQPIQANYSTCKQYEKAIDYSCQTAEDCTVKNIGAVCSYNFFKCVNVNSVADHNFVRDHCELGPEEYCGAGSQTIPPGCLCEDNQCVNNFFASTSI